MYFLLQDSRLFEWIDGPLVEAMRTGQMFLADEISLGDDSVLERLNSLLGKLPKLMLNMATSFFDYYRLILLFSRT